MAEELSSEKAIKDELEQEELSKTPPIDSARDLPLIGPLVDPVKDALGGLDEAVQGIADSFGQLSPEEGQAVQIASDKGTQEALDTVDAIEARRQALYKQEGIQQADPSTRLIQGYFVRVSTDRYNNTDSLLLTSKIR
jgi:hypothetical protein